MGVSTGGSGKRKVQFVGPDKKRRTLYLGKCPLKIAQEVSLRIESLVTSKVMGADVLHFPANRSVLRHNGSLQSAISLPRSSRTSDSSPNGRPRRPARLRSSSTPTWQPAPRRSEKLRSSGSSPSGS